MPNTNPQAVAFDNNYARPGANNVVSSYLTMKRIIQVFDGELVSNVIPNDATVISDGASVDGRPIVTNGQIVIEINNMRTIVALFEANSNLILNQFLQVSNSAQSAVS